MTAALAAERRAERERMVERQIAARGIRDTAVLDAMRRVPRELFVPAELAAYAYEDIPLEIPARQTISQPYVVALMIEALGVRPTDRVLEIGAGSGYAAALLGEIASRVFALERHAALVDYARDRLTRLGSTNVTVVHADGTLGWSEQAPFDAILVSAGGPQVPTPLREQLAIGGRLVIPVGAGARSQRLMRITRRGPVDWREDDLGDVAFVPLVGAEGWREQDE